MAGAADFTRSDQLCRVDIEQVTCSHPSCDIESLHTAVCTLPFGDAKLHTFVDELCGSCSRNLLWISG